MSNDDDIAADALGLTSAPKSRRSDVSMPEPAPATPRRTAPVPGQSQIIWAAENTDHDGLIASASVLRVVSFLYLVSCVVLAFVTGKEFGWIVGSQLIGVGLMGALSIWITAQVLAALRDVVSALRSIQRDQRTVGELVASNRSNR